MAHGFGLVRWFLFCRAVCCGEILNQSEEEYMRD